MTKSVKNVGIKCDHASNVARSNTILTLILKFEFNTKYKY